MINAEESRAFVLRFIAERGEKDLRHLVGMLARCASPAEIAFTFSVPRNRARAWKELLGEETKIYLLHPAVEQMLSATKGPHAVPVS